MEIRTPVDLYLAACQKTEATDACDATLGQGQEQFTPGPWRCPNIGIEFPPYRTVIADSQGEVCSVWNVPGNHSQIAEANARLIAAAPDLYQALSDLIEAANNGANLEPYYDEEIDELWDAAKRAIRAARGEVSI
jgi:hypothetical protein